MNYQEQLFNKLEELVTMAFPELNTDDLTVEVTVGTDNLVHVFDCIIDHSTRAVMTVQDLRRRQLCHVGLRADYGVVPEPLIDAICDRDVADTVAKLDISRHVTETCGQLRTRQVTTTEQAVELAFEHLRRVERRTELTSKLTAEITKPVKRIEQLAAQAITDLHVAHHETISHPRIRQLLALHPACTCVDVTVAFESLPVWSFMAPRQCQDNPDWGRAFALCAGYLAAPLGFEQVGTMPSCAYEFIRTVTPTSVLSSAHVGLTSRETETAIALWQPETSGPLSHFDRAVESARLLLQEHQQVNGTRR